MALLPLLLFPKLLDPRSAFFYRDILAYWVPQVESFARAIAEGSWPLWNPYVGFGSPMLADASHQIFYPFTWLNLILSPAVYYKALLVTHTAFTGIGLFRLARLAGLREWPAFCAAALWESSGPFLSTAALYHHFVSAAWIPWVLIGVERTLAAPSLRCAARLGLAAAVLLLGGSGDVGLMTALLACLRGLTHLASERPPLAVALRVARSAALAALLALGVASAQWIPTLAQLGSSGRAQMPAEARTYWSLAPIASLDLVVPRLVAEAPLSAPARASLYQAREPFLTCLYLGAASVPLVVLGALARGPLRAWLVLGLLLFFGLALGRFNPAYPELARVPPFSLLRYPVKYLLPFTLLWCLLAGRGLDTWLQPGGRRGPQLAALAGALALVGVSAAACGLLGTGAPASQLWGSLIAPDPEAQLSFVAKALEAFATSLAVSAAASALLFRRLVSAASARWTALAAGLLALADTALVGRTINPAGPAALLRHVPPVVAHLLDVRDELRVFVLPAEREWMISQLARGPLGWDAEARWSLGLLELLQPPSGARYALFGSYDGDFTGLTPAAQSELRGILLRYRDTPLALRLLRLGNVGRVVTLGPAGFADLPEAAPPLRSVFREPIRLLRAPSPLPRFYAVDRVRVAGGAASHAALAEPAFDPEREIILAPPAAEARGVASFSGSQRLLERRMNRLSLEAELSSDGFAVLVEAWDAGWRAWVDGRPAPVLRANMLFRAVPVPAGRHRVELAYRPPAAAWGVLIGAASLAAAVAFAARRR